MFALKVAAFRTVIGKTRRVRSVYDPLQTSSQFFEIGHAFQNVDLQEQKPNRVEMLPGAYAGLPQSFCSFLFPELRCCFGDPNVLQKLGMHSHVSRASARKTFREPFHGLAGANAVPFSGVVVKNCRSISVAPPTLLEIVAQLGQSECSKALHWSKSVAIRPVHSCQL